MSQSIREWLDGTQDTPLPGRVALFVGAGISMDPPTALPGAEQLVTSLAYHALAPRAAEELLDTYRTHASVIGRATPRLEHLLTVLARSCGREALEILNVFKDVQPNRIHHLVADYLLSTHGWAITTNFDTGIETASKFNIPVHILDETRGVIRVLHGSADETWGLIKVHGTIEEGVQQLGATLENLLPDLHPAWRTLLDQVFSNVDAVVVAGYSASDHFDVSGYLRPRLNKPFRARLVWIDHTADSSITSRRDLETVGFKVFRGAFPGRAVLSGNTARILSTLLGPGDVADIATPAGSISWQKRLAEAFAPTPAQRYRAGADLFANIGLSAAAHEQIARLRHELNDDDEGLGAEAEAYKREGAWSLADRSLQRLEAQNGTDHRLQRIALIRESGRPWRALAKLAAYWARRRLSGRADFKSWLGLRTETATAVLDIFEQLHGWRACRSGMARKTVDAVIEGLLRQTNASPRPPHFGHPEALRSQDVALVEGVLSLLTLRRATCCGNPIADHDAGQDLWLLLEDGDSAPQAFFEGRPLIPGGYLLTGTTCLELDRLSELLDVHLRYAAMTVTLIRREYLRWRHQDRHSDGLWLGNDDEFETLRASLAPRVATLRSHLRRADALADALGEDYLKVKVATAWVQADTLVGGLSSWRPIRLYLPLRPSDRVRICRQDAPSPIRPKS